MALKAEDIRNLMSKQSNINDKKAIQDIVNLIVKLAKEDISSITLSVYEDPCIVRLDSINTLSDNKINELKNTEL